MNLAQTYSSHYGLDVDKPFIFEKFYPLKHKNYLTLHLGNDDGEPNYLYWQEVINLISPHFIKKYNNDISFVLTNTKTKIQYGACNQLTGTISPNELAYIIKNSEMHISEGGLDLDFASYYDKKIVYAANASEPPWNSSHLKIDNDKNIKELKPEDVAVKILNFLKIEFEPFSYKTMFIGDNYINKTMQIIPEETFDFQNPFGSPLVIRMDKFFDEKSLSFYLARHQCIIVTNKKINNQILSNFKKNIFLIVFVIEEDDDPSFISNVRKANISANLISYLDEKEIKKKKANYMEYGIITKVDIPNKENIKEIENEETSSLLYVSNGPILHNRKTYKSIFDWKNGIQAEENGAPTKVIENEEFWKEINNLYLFKKVD